jgi:hypothetical protein
LLNTYQIGISTVQALKVPGSKEAKTKAQKEEEKQRPLRLDIEVGLVKCDLALSMGTVGIKWIKRRAIRDLKHKGEEEEEEEEEKEEDQEEGAEWEAIAEEALVRCLETAKELMEEKRGAVLSDTIDQDDWVHDYDSAKPVTHKKALPDPDSDEDSEASSTSSSEDDADEDGQETYPCPLRTLFRLHDRYEEQRLAVWLGLPSDTRPGMGTYLRGGAGRVGEAWDGLGVLLLLDYDGYVPHAMLGWEWRLIGIGSDTLSSLGLSGDKLDKWVELASRRNSKKIRRRGRKTI